MIISDDCSALLHIMEAGNGFVSFQLRGLEFMGTGCHSEELQMLKVRWMGGGGWVAVGCVVTARGYVRAWNGFVCWVVGVACFCVHCGVDSAKNNTPPPLLPPLLPSEKKNNNTTNAGLYQ